MPKSSVERGIQLEISSDTGRTFEDSGYCKYIYYLSLCCLSKDSYDIQVKEG